ncbi:DUF6883 domain-containing protein [Spirulina subsalsa]|uniref:DUF6883 domain-containing protein n=1 Tax=Spirulina subsalsa TaxID=54311 RepID=UPI0002D876B7|nr:DUF6883 domain-containing protein [Spirulina subsalsa]
MQLPENVIIPDAKLTQYLLVFREQDDKSKFLQKAGFTQENSEALKNALLQLVKTQEAIEDTQNEYGTFYRIEGKLEGETGTINVTTIWLQRAKDSQFQFITLKPKKEKKHD